MILVPELLMDVLRRERELTVTRDLEQRRLVAVLRAAARCCRTSFIGRLIGTLRHPAAGSPVTS